ncbi:phosphotransferase [Prevotella sp.]|uniref:phosphotransferase n=1 Tax=Prevotella sp. TaxID=59823 RepID=UPI003DA49226
MKLYRFKTFVTSYYFPQINKHNRFMYDLYGNYGCILGKIYWWLFKNVSLVRLLNMIDSSNLDFPYDDIVNIEGNGSLMAFNLGSPGPDRKISILGYDSIEKKDFFAKYSVSKKAQKLTNNEVRIYNLLKNNGFVPKVYLVKRTDDFVFMKVERIVGSKVRCTIDDNLVLACLNDLSKLHVDKSADNNTCFSHGDFCPWNMILVRDQIKLIDWEMAAERPLGYDLFTYIFQTNFAVNHKDTIAMIIDKNSSLINAYFQCKDYLSYIRLFAKIKYEEMSNKDINSYYANRYLELINYFK